MQDLWVFKHEPDTIDNMIVSDEKRLMLRKIIDELPTTLIAGNPGTGKGTFMNCLIKETGVDVLKINGSDETGVDVMRDKVKSFATAYSSRKKIVYINECDRLSPNAIDSILQLQEDVQHLTRFFFICNNPSKISEPLISRCTYQLDPNDPPAKQIFLYVVKMLSKEMVDVPEKSLIVEVIKKLYPDIRQIIGTLQSNVTAGALNKISFSLSSDVYQQVFDFMIANDVEGVRKMLKSHHIEYDDLFEYVYKLVMDEPDMIKLPAEFILATGEYLYRNALVGIKEINFMAYVFDLMKKGIL